MGQRITLKLGRGCINVNNFTIEYPQINFMGGNWYQLSGPSGVGKTTFIRGLLGLSDYKLEKSMICPNCVGYVPQDFRVTLFPWMSGLENLMIFGNEPKDSVLEIAASIGLGKSMLKRKVFKMSGGQCQRISLLRELLLRPNFLVIDEPFSNLDKNTSSIVSDQMISLLPVDACVIISSHQEIPDGIKNRLITLELQEIKRDYSKLTKL